MPNKFKKDNYLLREELEESDGHVQVNNKSDGNNESTIENNYGEAEADLEIKDTIVKMSTSQADGHTKSFTASVDVPFEESKQLSGDDGE